MPVDEASPFSARIIAEGKDLWFRDMGDMVLYLRDKIDPAPARVKDYLSGAYGEADDLDSILKRIK